MTYNAEGKRITSENLAGQVTTTAWDCCHKISETEPDGSITTWDYDDEGRMIASSRLIPPDMTNVTWLTTCYKYDALGRQTEARDAAGITTFHYDSFGSPINETIVGVAGTNTIIRNWDAYGRTTGYSLAGRVVPDAPQRQTTISYDPATGRLATMLANGTARTFEYFWGADKSGSEQGAGGVEGLQAVSVDGAFYIPCYDHNGNIVLYVSENGSIAAQFNYHPYGNVIDQTDAKCDDFSFRFSTKFTDVETGLVSFQFRHYHPAPGRWLNRDPIGEIGGNNLYIFSANSPSVYYDVLGYSWEIKRDGAIFAKAKATSSTDTFQSLAELLKLDATDYKLWAHTTDSSPIRCKEYGTIGSAMWLWSDFLWVTKVASIF